ncbi:hypothetical protein RSK60_1720008 [Ralstonia solanacearum K60]|nr:hypothetical protein RSK60_1720008 [Ralstonia solanacearum K60]
MTDSSDIGIGQAGRIAQPKDLGTERRTGQATHMKAAGVDSGSLGGDSNGIGHGGCGEKPADAALERARPPRTNEGKRRSIRAQL